MLVSGNTDGIRSQHKQLPGLRSGYRRGIESSAGLTPPIFSILPSLPVSLTRLYKYSPVIKAATRLLAMRTNGDGNCLVHSVSVALWGQHDRTLVSLENIAWY